MNYEIVCYGVRAMLMENNPCVYRWAELKRIDFEFVQMKTLEDKVVDIIGSSGLILHERHVQENRIDLYLVPKV